MSHRIQITVDDELNQIVKVRAKQMGLSVSSYVRLALMGIFSGKSNKLLDQAMADIKSNDTESLTLTDFNKQLDD